MASQQFFFDTSCAILFLDNPDHLILRERSVDGLHRSGKFGLKNYKKPKVHTFPCQSTQRVSIAGMVLECLCPRMSDDILQQIVSEASAAAKNRTSDV